MRAGEKNGTVGESSDVCRKGIGSVLPGVELGDAQRQEDCQLRQLKRRQRKDMRFSDRESIFYVICNLNPCKNMVLSGIREPKICFMKEIQGNSRER